DRLVVMDDDGLGDVPALPAGAAGAVSEVDVVAVEAVALVEAAEVLEHLAAEEEERAEEPIGWGRLGRALVEEVVAALAALGVEDAAEGGAAHERAAHRREAAAGGLPAIV